MRNEPTALPRQLVRGIPLGRCALSVTLGLIVSTSVLSVQGAQSTEPRIQPLESADGINISKTLAHHPELADAWLTFASYVLRDSTLPPRHRELLILRIGYLCGSEYEWGQHTRIARDVGLTDEEIVRVIEGPDAAGWSSFERTLLRATDELHHDAYVSDRTWGELEARYDTKQLMDVVFTVGEYNLVSMALKTFRVPLDEGVQGFPR
jgi:4-carboxymuconolactone decarboxylase